MKVLRFLAIILAFLLTACSQSSNGALPYSEELQAILDSTSESTGLVGVSAAIIVPGYEPWVGVSGESYAEQPITEDIRLLKKYR